MDTTVETATESVTILRDMRHGRTTPGRPCHSSQRRPDPDLRTAELPRALCPAQPVPWQQLHRRRTGSGPRRHRGQQAQTHRHLKEHEHHAPSHRIKEQSRPWRMATRAAVVPPHQRAITTLADGDLCQLCQPCQPSETRCGTTGVGTRGRSRPSRHDHAKQGAPTLGRAHEKTGPKAGFRAGQNLLHR